jgi:hypothetical protein
MQSTRTGVMPEPRPELLGLRLQTWRAVWGSFWGWMILHASLPAWYQHVLLALVLLAAVGVAIALRRPGARAIRVSHTLYLVLGPVVMFATYVLLALQWPFGVQGRLLLPAVPVFVFFLLVGLGTFVPLARPRWGAVAVSVASCLWILLLMLGNGILLADIVGPSG